MVGRRTRRRAAKRRRTARGRAATRSGSANRRRATAAPVCTTRTMTVPMTTRMPIVTQPGEARPAEVDHEHAGRHGGDQRPPEPDEQRGGDDPHDAGDPAGPHRHGRLGGRPAGPGRAPTSARCGGRTAPSAMQASTAMAESTRAMVSGRCAVQLIVTVTGALARRDAPAVEAAVDELRRAEVAIVDRRRPTPTMRRCSPHRGPASSRRHSRRSSPCGSCDPSTCTSIDQLRRSAPSRPHRRRARRGRPAGPCPMRSSTGACRPRA